MVDLMNGRTIAAPLAWRPRGLNMPHVDSSMMTRAEYDESTAELDITFRSGKTYRYLRVPPDIYTGLIEAESKGEFFNDESRTCLCSPRSRGDAKPNVARISANRVATSGKINCPAFRFAPCRLPLLRATPQAFS